MKVRAFDEETLEQKKARERAAIQAFISAKRPRIALTKQNSIEEYKELSEAMYHQTSKVLPDNLKGALEGQTADAAHNYLKEMRKPGFKTPVRGG